MFYVYHLIDPRSDSVFYVGKGQRGRVDAHEKEARAGSEHPKCEVIRAIWADGHRVKKIKVQHFSDEAQAYLFEEEQIASIGLDNLTNLLPGGGGIRPYVETKGIARKLLRSLAAYIRLKHSGRRLSYPWGMAADRTLPHTLSRLAKDWGIEFVGTELARYGVRVV